MNRRPDSGLADVLSPTLVGALVALTTLIAVFISYNANRGLPFVPTYDIKVTVPDARELVAGNEVRIGGHRIGQVSSIEAVTTEEGRPVAEVGLQLDADRDPLLDDTRVEVRFRSPLAGKFIDLQPGTDGEPLAPGSTLPIEQGRVGVQLDDLFNELDAEARSNLQRVLGGLGAGLAGRGTDVNRAIAESAPLLRSAQPVLRDLAARRGRIARLVQDLAATGEELASVSPELVALVRSAEQTFAAIEAAGPELEETLVQAPGSIETGRDALGTLRPVFRQARSIVGDLRPGVRRLPRTATRLVRAIDIGLPVLDHAVRLAPELEGALEDLRRLAAEVPTAETFRRLEQILTDLRPTLEHLAPAQLVCNYVGILLRNLSSTLTEGDRAGTWIRLQGVLAVEQQTIRSTPSPRLHFNPYPNHASPGQDHECEAGNEPYLPGQQIGNVPMNVGTETDDTSPRSTLEP